MQDKPTLEDTLALMRDLRRRCEWDRAQTHDSLRPYLIEEAHEVDDAIRSGDDAMLREELGDLLLQVLFHSVVAEERGAFDLHDVAHSLITKMRARHPHLYPPDGQEPGERQSWESMKARKRRGSIEEGLPSGLPSLHRAHRLQDRAAGVGFDWPDVDGPAAKVEEELAEVRDELHGGSDATRLEAEIGDLLFAVVNLARKAGVHASLALDKANAKFAARFSAIEKLAAERGIDVNSAGLTVLDQLWDEVKAAGSDR
ncbi:MazG family protein [Gemmatirosa kalamazoonensis]|uniref:MazG family protein n=1 Tax=Gemmatirosa kalamazoonensis TaxID=861299 RepID=W0RHN6_9BACT|nr:nucleoside triphosphate pyrophosphohydrolase [Gemmatirosa kalamazoonensis]AHG90629.1 MazG family protein [Gemmatirosa kalamazoonensis]